MERIHIVLDLSISMRDMIGPVYFFLAEMIRRISKEGTCRYSLTWFTGKVHDTEEYEYTTELFDGIPVTDKPFLILDAIRGKTLQSGKKSSEEAVRLAIREALNSSESEEAEAEEKIFLFTDFRCMNLNFTFSGDKALRRAVLFLPESVLHEVHTSFLFRTEKGLSRDIPCQLIALEDLTGKWNEQDWDSFLSLI